MSNTKYYAELGDGHWEFVIEESPGLGWYLYAYFDKKCMRDYLQDTLTFAKEQAYDEFKVPITEWRFKGSEPKP